MNSGIISKAGTAVVLLVEQEQWQYYELSTNSGSIICKTQTAVMLLVEQEQR